PYSVTYDGAAHTATGTATGVLGETLSGLSLSGTTHTNAGSYASDPWTFTDSTGNYNNASGTVNDEIATANATIADTLYSASHHASAPLGEHTAPPPRPSAVPPCGVTYGGAAPAATGTAKGVGGASLSGLNLSGTTHTSAGTYTDSWTFTDSTGNYNNASGTV